MAFIIGCIFAFLFSVACFIYGFMAWRYRGPILMNKYVLASKEEKNYLKRISEKERKEDYRYAAKVSFGIGAVWLLYFLSFITKGLANQMFFWLGNGVIVVLICYSLRELFQHNRS